MYSFRMSFWMVPRSLVVATPCSLRRGDVEAEQHRGGAVDRHRGGDLIERDAVEQRLHVGQAGDGDAALADLALRARVVGVVSHQGRKSNATDSPVWPRTAETCSGDWCRRRCRSRRTGAWSRADRDTGRMHAASVGILARQAGSPPTGLGREIERRVHRLDFHVGDRRKVGIIAHRQSGGVRPPRGDFRPQLLPVPDREPSRVIRAHPV